MAQISPRPPPPAYGLLGGTAYGSPPSTSIRSSLPSSESRFWARSCGSPASPPSPMPIYSIPSGPNTTSPPLWFGYGCFTNRISLGDELQCVGRGRRSAAGGRLLAAGNDCHSAEVRGDHASDGHLASREILPLKLRTVTCAPPVPVEKRSVPRCGASAVSRLVTDPPMVSRSKSATVVPGTRTTIAPLWLSSSRMPPSPSSPSNRTSPVTD